MSLEKDLVAEEVVAFDTVSSTRAYETVVPIPVYNVITQWAIEV